MSKSVLLLRPKPSIDTSERRLREMGLDTLALPLIRIESLPLSDAARAGLQQPWDIGLCVSVHAVHSLLQQQLRPADLARVWLAVGDATAEVLSEAGVETVVTPEQHSSAGLLRLEPLRECGDKSVLLLRGKDGFGMLRDQLAGRCARWQELDLYCRQPVVYSRSQVVESLRQVAGVLLTSMGALDALVEQLEGDGELLGRLSALALSQRIADRARERGFGNALYAADSRMESLYGVVRIWSATT